MSKNKVKDHRMLKIPLLLVILAAGSITTSYGMAIAEGTHVELIAVAQLASHLVNVSGYLPATPLAAHQRLLELNATLCTIARAHGLPVYRRSSKSPATEIPQDFVTDLHYLRRNALNLRTLPDYGDSLAHDEQSTIDLIYAALRQIQRSYFDE